MGIIEYLGNSIDVWQICQSQENETSCGTFTDSSWWEILKVVTNNSTAIINNPKCVQILSDTFDV